MAIKIREYWFGLLMIVWVVVTLLFVLIVAIAPHNDIKMRGFTPCTYDMAGAVSDAGSSRHFWGVMSGVGKGYLCYARVMKQGFALWIKGEQPTFWSNYLFEPEVYDATPAESEPLSKELLNANLLDDEEESTVWQGNTSKESIDERK